MAVHAIIQKMNSAGLPATMELPGGTWCHTPEYLRYRYGGAGTVAKPKIQDSGADLLGTSLKKLTKSEQKLLLAMLEEV